MKIIPEGKIGCNIMTEIRSGQELQDAKGSKRSMVIGRKGAFVENYSKLKVPHPQTENPAPISSASSLGKHNGNVLNTFATFPNVVFYHQVHRLKPVPVSGAQILNWYK